MQDEYVIVLDYLPYGHPEASKAEAIAQVIGERYFNLLEVVIKENKEVKPGDRLYVGKGRRDLVAYIKRRIKLSDLTSLAKERLDGTIENLIKQNERSFINFLNKAGALTPRMHSLELLSGIGKKQMWRLIEEREKKPFESFKDLKKRVPMLQQPIKMLVKRIKEELEGKDRHKLFVNSKLFALLSA